MLLFFWISCLYTGGSICDIIIDKNDGKIGNVVKVLVYIYGKERRFTWRVVSELMLKTYNEQFQEMRLQRTNWDETCYGPSLPIWSEKANQS